MVTELKLSTQPITRLPHVGYVLGNVAPENNLEILLIIIRFYAAKYMCPFNNRTIFEKYKLRENFQHGKKNLVVVDICSHNMFNCYGVPNPGNAVRCAITS